ncbi:type II toxin-antitoxin system VapC family toxin [Sphingomonas sp. BK235]|uniref:type II toxin-antitoxin system VapC family toxin n=1 Tax=Sphingomonas sp. BK235 TaxID=2512131 RepID=UPI0010467926|nr:type II toxin-antitoxin system VapC family toxin [Sphingomonas sp. BK235]TCP37227.1 hypothetical protein EV292_101736 [Sphingomonas sp. BK235]
MIFLDTNVVIDLFGAQQSVGAAWSRDAYRAVADRLLMVNLVVVAELAGYATRPERLLDRLQAFRITAVDLTVDACFAAGTAFREYRRRGGARDAMLADFLIAGHAVALGASLMTRDRRLSSYFPNLTLITPETDHG